MEKKVANRWVVLVASMLCNLCIGAAYAWSVFQGPVIETFGWSPSQVSLTFTLILGMMPIAMFISGYLQDKWGSTKTLILGGGLFGIGVFLASLTKSLGYLLLTHGFLAGLGVGTVYSCSVAAAKWFPDKSGLASGLIAAGLGMGAFFFAPIGNSLIESYGVLTAFKILGIVHLVCIIVCAFLVKDPPANYKPEGWEPPQVASLGVSGLDKSPKEMLSDGMFYLLWTLFVLGAVAGLMIIGHASPIGQKVVGLSVAEATKAVSILALANTGGRVFWGTVSDKVGRYPALAALYATSALSMFYLTTVSSYVSFVIAICLAALCFGGLLGIFPTITADLFGKKYLSQNFGIIFSAFAAAAIIGPTLAAKVVEASGGYSLAFIVAAVMGAIGIILTLFVQSQLKKRIADSDTTISS